MPKILEIRLSPAKRFWLKRLQKRTKSARLSRRIAALLLLDAGARVSQILKSLSISRWTLRHWKQRWLKHGTAGLRDQEHSGRPPRAKASYIARMMRAVRQDPRKLGYAFTRWTAPRLAAYLREATGVRLTDAWVTELLRMHGWVWRK